MSQGMCPRARVLGHMSWNKCPGTCFPRYVSQGTCPRTCVQGHVYGDTCLRTRSAKSECVYWPDQMLCGLEHLSSDGSVVFDSLLVLFDRFVIDFYVFFQSRLGEENIQHIFENISKTQWRWEISARLIFILCFMMYGVFVDYVSAYFNNLLCFFFSTLITHRY